MLRARSSFAPQLGLVLASVMLVVACDSGGGDRSPTGPTTPPVVPFPSPSTTWMGTGTFVSGPEANNCGLDATSLVEPWWVQIDGLNIALEIDPISGSGIHRGTLDGNRFEAAYESLSGAPCGDIRSTFTGSFRADRRAFDATQVMLVGPAGEYRLEWRWSVVAQ